jgi:hypothetical protein
MSPGILITPGYGGLLYEVLYNGDIMALQVAPAHARAGNSTGVVNGRPRSHYTDDNLYTSRLTYLLKVAARKTGQKKPQETKHEHAMEVDCSTSYFCHS